ncbi:hypothetical protein [Burkholderia multivorans]|uniref:Uncharacterized protein n=1 Tax=Burkholderia vietnamiensis (strain G4 / LMG 22486) TaxID=269482 RepID=A4JHB0_BURVG|nr:hypothetical protein [Burkholderia multivorans]ABO55663.1 hypothetical protein Bcep1808_2671 [Burkholderia vietnamiensis G4]MBU9553881.1 hypothetical protein [Burkholderia multivorans]MCB4345420.1 hypothetical protein [Burkholderia vietnamiensis]
MSTIKKSQPKIHKTMRIDFLIGSVLSEYSKKTNLPESHIIELALKEYFEARDNEQSLRMVSSQLEILTARLERIENGNIEILKIAKGE